jgi:tripartite-type tricarboxylate transporter receptor subunit TctC
VTRTARSTVIAIFLICMHPWGADTCAQANYPTRPVRLIIGFPPGGAGDLVGRLNGQALSERLGQPIVIENRPGAAGNIATEAVVRSPPDGYTLLQIGSPNSYNMTLYDPLSFNFLRDIAPVASIIRGPGVVVVHPSFPVKSIPELIAYAQANPGKINMASAGVGSPQHVYGELFKMMTGVDMLHVSYRGGGPALSDLLAGHVQVMFDTLSTSIEHIKAGKLRALAVTSATRSELLPDIPTLGEFVPGYEATGWQGIGAPKDTAAEIIDKLNKEVNAGLADPEMKAKLAGFGYTVFTSSPVEFATFIAEFTEKWAKVLKFTGAKVD